MFVTGRGYSQASAKAIALCEAKKVAIESVQGQRALSASARCDHTPGDATAPSITIRC